MKTLRYRAELLVQPIIAYVILLGSYRLQKYSLTKHPCLYSFALFSHLFNTFSKRETSSAFADLSVSAPSEQDAGSPGSKVQSSRGALLDIPFRFFKTLLMMFPTPPETCCRCLAPTLGLLPALESRSCLILYLI